jgi:hypothetical protein
MFQQGQPGPAGARTGRAAFQQHFIYKNRQWAWFGPVGKSLLTPLVICNQGASRLGGPETGFSL